MWQCSKCTKTPVDQLFLYFLFWTCMSEIESGLHFFLAGKCATKNLKKTYTILVYGHVDIIIMVLDISMSQNKHNDFWPD